MAVTVSCNLANSNTVDTRYALTHDWHGKVLGTYPDLIPINVSVKFQHISVVGTDISESAVVYTDDTYDWMVCWYAAASGNKVYTEIHEAGYFKNISDWAPFKTKLEAGTNKSENVWGAYKATVEINAGILPVLDANICKK